MKDELISIRQVTKSYGKDKILSDISLEIFEGDKLAIVEEMVQVRQL